MRIIDLLNSLTALPGVSGNEKIAVEKAACELAEFANIRTDALGNLIGEIDGTGPHIMLDAHIDQIGMVVTAIDKSGFLRIDKCGGIDIRVLAATEVIVYGKKPLYGIIISTPPHLAKEEDAKKALDIEKLAVDVGLPFEQVKDIVGIGDRIVLKQKLRPLMNNRVFSVALDNRAGAAAIIRCLDILRDKAHNCKISVLFSVTEETASGGAKVGSFALAPEQAITVDVSFGDSPDISPQKCGKLGQGVMIGISPSLSNEMSMSLIEIAKDKNIPYQPEVMGGRTSTNADDISISGTGIKTALLSIPLRNMHTGGEVVELNDIENTAALMAEYIMNLGGGSNA